MRDIALWAVQMGREAAEALMTDTILVERITGTTTNPDLPFDQITTYEPVYGPDIEPHKGKAKFQKDKTYESAGETGDSIRTKSRGELHVPVGAFVAEVGMRVTTIASPDDPESVGNRARLAEPMPQKTKRTADRHNVESEGSDRVS